MSTLPLSFPSTRMQETRRARWLRRCLPLLAPWLGLLWPAGEARGDGVPQITTSKSIPEATVSVIDPESGTSSGGGTTDVNVGPGDIILFRIHFAALPDKLLRGVQGYLTDYIPANTEVVGVRIIDADGLTLPPRYPSLAPDGCGNACNSFNAVPCSAGGGCSGGTRSLAAGSIAQVYADTGVFYATDVRLMRNPGTSFLTFDNGILMSPEPELADRMALFLETASPFYAHNDWDWDQVQAYGYNGCASGTDGRDNTPHLYGSPVAGPDTWYLYEATDNAGAIELNDAVGPWARVRYPGSQLGTGTAGGSGAFAPLERTIQPTAAGWDVKPNSPLPAGTEAVRVALGAIRVGEPGTVEIALRVLDTPLDPVQGADVNCTETFGTDSAASLSRDNPWPLYLASPACVRLNLKFDIDVDRAIALTNDLINYTLSGKNLSLNAQDNVVVSQTWDPAREAFVSATGAYTLLDSDNDGNDDTLQWSLGTLQPSDDYLFESVFDVAGGGNRSAPMYARYQGQDSVTSQWTDYTTQAVTVIVGITVVEAELTCTTDPAAAGGTASVTGTLANAGTSEGTYESLVLGLPAGWTVVPGSVVLGGVTLTCSNTGSSEPSCTIGDIFQPGESRALGFDVNVPAGAAAGLYPLDLQVWASQQQVVQSNPYDTYFPAVATVAVEEPRSAIPVIDCPIDRMVTAITGTTSEPDGTVITLYFNGIARAATSASGGAWSVPQSAWDDGTTATFGELYAGLEIRATADAPSPTPGGLESQRSAACFVTAIPACSDGIDNDGDGYIDFPADPGCEDLADGSEDDAGRPQCSDGIDNDGDGHVDYPADPSCQDEWDDTEDGPPACSDGVDNDDDGLVDYPDDLGCTGPDDPSEVDYHVCMDGVDNDGDGLVDFPDDPGCHSWNDGDEQDFVFADQPIKPRLLVLFDTSGSMNWHTCASEFTGGDGSDECPGNDVDCATCSASGCGNGVADDSRIHKVKLGVGDAVAAYGNVEWGLMRFHQRAEPFTCPTANATLRSGGWQGAGAAPCGGGFNAGDLLVRFSPDNTYDLLDWLDLEDNYPGTAPAGMDIELRGSGTTPIAGSLGTAHTYLGDVRATDAQAACRPYRVVLVTDGDETCGGDPVAKAGELYGDGIPVHVIGFATSDPEITTNLDDIASAGGTGSAVFADDEVSLSSAIAEIISESILVEECNGVDDDCDGDVDEDFPDLGDSCDNGETGECLEYGVMVCRSDGTGTECDAPAGTPTTEVCDGADNDCDGLIDEDDVCLCSGPELCNDVDDYCDNWASHPEGSEDPQVGQPCGSDVGACVSGTTVCQPGGVIECTDTGPTAEVCDDPASFSDPENADQNCNGVNNDGVAPRTCSVTNTYGTCEGLEFCDENGDWVGCSAPEPAPEVCNGADDDCDGDVDEGLTQPCAVQNAYGTCTGTETCNAGAWEGCTAATPAAETCNNADDDCDGAVDEGLSRACSESNAHGTCTGTETCSAGAWEGCTAATPAAETCNNADDDCDGDVDEGLSRACYTGPAGTENVGVCSGGSQSCTSGVWGTCSGQVLPSGEICDGLDNDCDGQTDEGLGQTTCGLGECEHTADNCVGGVSQSCDPLLGATAETCDGLDNDCDGQIDGLSAACYPYAAGCTEVSPGSFSCTGVCVPGLQLCPAGSGGTWGACQLAVGPSAEICDNLDNDCDGDVDEDATGLPLSSACYSPGSGPNTGCQQDPSTGAWSCTGACEAGTRTCTTGVWSGCQGETTPTVEACNGVDDDCDGQVDEEAEIPGLGLPCGSPLGRCTAGVLRCVDGQEVCEGGEGPYPGECNGLDDDCDGQADEPDEVADFVGQPCGEATGQCEAGQTDCVGGQIVCVGGDGATPEVCNGEDDDCDGRVDEPDDGALCPPRYHCLEADCRRECDPENPCPPGTVCEERPVDGQPVLVCMPDLCSGQVCAPGEQCVDGQCVDPCEGVSCRWWQECASGYCVDRSCSAPGVDCPPNEICVDHACLADPCAEAGCDPETEYCVPDCDTEPCTARCEPLCRCPPDERCVEPGVCAQDPCAEAQCEAGERCDPETGLCAPDPCEGVDCPSGEQCYAGACAEDPCQPVRCSAFHHCVVLETTNELGEPALEPVCQADPQFYNPQGDELLATGSGGCGCATGNGPPGGSPTLLGLLGLLLWIRRRGAQGRKGGAR